MSPGAWMLIAGAVTDAMETVLMWLYLVRLGRKMLSVVPLPPLLLPGDPPPREGLPVSETGEVPTSSTADSASLSTTWLTTPRDADIDVVPYAVISSSSLRLSPLLPADLDADPTACRQPVWRPPAHST